MTSSGMRFARTCTIRRSPGIGRGADEGVGAGDGGTIVVAIRLLPT
jgi:hypothetical protein